VPRIGRGSEQTHNNCKGIAQQQGTGTNQEIATHASIISFLFFIGLCAKS
jgi:hypothetical protein